MIYAVGDIQGCFDELKALLDLVRFNPYQDQLWLAGDLVNRGPKSLAVLRFLTELAHPPKVVLGNHDMHLLAVAADLQPLKAQDTFADILTAPDTRDLLHWLRQQPLLQHQPELNFTMVHAGIFPAWSLAEATQYANEIHQQLRSEHYQTLLQQMYGNTPAHWSPTLTGAERYRFIINAFTRMRYCMLDGQLDLQYKGKVGSQAESYLPWFKLPDRKTKADKILFGHWAALNGITNEPNVFALDTGCAWGNCLTALRLEDKKYFQVPSLQKPSL